MGVVAVRYSERPELWDEIAQLSAEVWPEYNLHGENLNRYWAHLYETFPDYQFVLYDEESENVLAEGHSIPIVWDGTREHLGPGIDASIEAGFDLRSSGGEPNTLCALAAEIPPRYRARGLSTALLECMVGMARGAGFAALIAPVRPNWKERYPLAPIERYAHWVRADGQPFDPWIRAHVRLGATIGPGIAESMHITGSVAEWEGWTSMTFPESASYVFPGGLTPLTIDRDKDVGDYWEPNVWLIHTIT